MSEKAAVEIGSYAAGWSDPATKYAFKSEPGLSEHVVRQLSEMKGEPAWMLDLRLRSLKHFLERPLPTWGGDLSSLDFENINRFFSVPLEKRLSDFAMAEGVRDVTKDKAKEAA